jgi:hypothetical protein
MVDSDLRNSGNFCNCTGLHPSGHHDELLLDRFRNIVTVTHDESWTAESKKMELIFNKSLAFGHGQIMVECWTSSNIESLNLPN